MASRNKPGCACCEPAPCANDCCESGAPSSVIDVVVPAGEFASDTGCGDCEDTNEQTFILFDAPGTCPVAGVSPTGTCQWVYNGPAPSCVTTQLCAWLETVGDQCRMAVAIEFAGAANSVTFLYRSALENTPINCTGKSWTCAYVSGGAAGRPCTSANTTLTVNT